MNRRFPMWVLPVLTLVALAGVATASASGTYDLSWWKVADGGDTFSSGGSYELGDTIGQPEAGSMSGGSYSLVGGFWSMAADVGASTFTVSGNAGVADATLSYEEAGSPKTATANGAGDYSFTIPEGWSGTVTPSKAGYIFNPESRTYSNVTTDQAGQDYAADLIPVTAIHPSEGAQVCRRPRLAVDLLLTALMRTNGSFDPAKVVLYLDGKVVTQAATFIQSEDYPASRATIQYIPTADLPLGSNWAALVYPTSWGPLTRAWIFTVADIPCQ